MKPCKIILKCSQIKTSLCCKFIYQSCQTIMLCFARPVRGSV